MSHWFGGSFCREKVFPGSCVGGGRPHSVVMARFGEKMVVQESCVGGSDVTVFWWVASRIICFFKSHVLVGAYRE